VIHLFHVKQIGNIQRNSKDLRHGRNLFKAFSNKRLPKPFWKNQATWGSGAS
jgi:hypothetical protein